MALRLALGAARRTVVRQLMDTSVRAVGAGCLVGLVLAVFFTRTLQTMLYGVSPATLVSVVLLVVSVAAFVSLAPALRTTIVQPMQVLRDE